MSKVNLNCVNATEQILLSEEELGQARFAIRVKNGRVFTPHTPMEGDEINAYNASNMSMSVLKHCAASTWEGKKDVLFVPENRVVARAIMYDGLNNTAMVSLSSGNTLDITLPKFPHEFLIRDLPLGLEILNHLEKEINVKFIELDLHTDNDVQVNFSPSALARTFAFGLTMTQFIYGQPTYHKFHQSSKDLLTLLSDISLELSD